jgi:hypothetical protein
MNLYGMLRANPLSYTDPFGRTTTQPARTWNNCCPEFLKCLQGILIRIKATQDRVADLAEDLLVLSAKARYLRDLFDAANSKNMNASAWDLLFSGSAEVQVARAGIGAFTSVRSITKLYGGVARAKKGVKGFQALSKLDKAIHKTAARAGIYGQVLAFAVDAGTAAANIHNIAEILVEVTDFTGKAELAFRDFRNKGKDILDLFEYFGKQWELFDGKQWDDSHKDACTKNTDACKGLREKIGKAMDEFDGQVAAIAPLVPQATQQLMGLARIQK